MGADDELVIKSAQGACIHDKIMTFPDGYETKVSELDFRHNVKESNLSIETWNTPVCRLGREV
jgi:ABC-type transport system involved in Fe-S cluster assembly fused permease/ATPase subunit